jgi:hypothetical protein
MIGNYPPVDQIGSYTHISGRWFLPKGIPLFVRALLTKDEIKDPERVRHASIRRCQYTAGELMLLYPLQCHEPLDFG